jgi:hypothetical protein
MVHSQNPHRHNWATDFFCAAPAPEDPDHIALSRLVRGYKGNGRNTPRGGHKKSTRKELMPKNDGNMSRKTLGE